MRKGLMILFLLLIFAFGLIGLQQGDVDQSGQIDEMHLILDK